MIFYYSGTGNSKKVASLLSNELETSYELITRLDPTDVSINDKDAIFVFPVYAWGVPPVMIDFIRMLPQSEIEKMKNGTVRVWCIAVCGDETGMAVEMFREELHKRDVAIDGAWSIIAPNVYVLLPGFDVDKRDVEDRKLDHIKPRVKEIAANIAKCKSGDPSVTDVHVGSWPRLKTRLVYPLFKRWGVNSRKWHWTKECIGCGRCASVCPEKNISMVGGHPQWGRNCDSCCACYHVCPTHAVEYGKVTIGKGQYKRLLK